MVATPIRIAVRTVRHLRIRVFSFLAYSVREGPDAEVTPDITPQAVQPLGLDDEEGDDEGAEQRETERGYQVEHGGLRKEDAAERLHGVADEDGQQGDEDGAEDRAQHGAEP